MRSFAVFRRRHFGASIALVQCPNSRKPLGQREKERRREGEKERRREREERKREKEREQESKKAREQESKRERGHARQRERGKEPLSRHQPCRSDDDDSEDNNTARNESRHQPNTALKSVRSTLDQSLNTILQVSIILQLVPCPATSLASLMTMTVGTTKPQEVNPNTNLTWASSAPAQTFSQYTNPK